ncbi:MAG: rhomboid family intramembrane serine protease [Bacteroidota bacterium]
MSLSLTLIIIIITVLISMQGFNNQDFLYKMALSPYNVKHKKQHFKLISHIFVHSDWPHLLFNMMSFYFLGDALLNIQPYAAAHISGGLVQTYGFVNGNLHFIVLYFVGGFFATFWPMIRNQDNPNYISLGASGAVSSVIFAMLLWNPAIELQLMFLPGIGIPAYVFGPLYLAFEFWAFKRAKTNIAHDAHIGGAVFGVLYVLIINIDKGKEFFSTILG